MTFQGAPWNMIHMYMNEISLMAAELVDETVADTFPARIMMGNLPVLELGRASLYRYTDRDEDQNRTVKQLSSIAVQNVGLEAGADVPESRLILLSANCQLPTRGHTDGCGRFEQQLVYGPENLEPLTVRIYAEASPNPQPYLPRVRDLSDRARTSEFVDWEIPPQLKSRHAGWQEQGVDPWQFDTYAERMFDSPKMPQIVTPDLAPLVREVIGLEGWQPGNQINFLFEFVAGTGIRYTDMDYSAQFDHYSLPLPILVESVASASDRAALHARCGGYGEAPGTTGGRVYPEANPVDPYVGRIACPVCGPGEFDHDLDPGTACEKCPSGTYNNETKAISCKLCPKFSVSEPGSTTQGACVPLMKVSWFVPKTSCFATKFYTKRFFQG